MAVRMKGPENHGGFSHAGASYTPDENGLIDVPHEAVGAARCHGFTVAEAQPESTPQPTPEPTEEPTPEPTGEPAGQTDAGAPIPNPDFTKLNKKQIAEFAKENLGLDLDASLTKDQMITAVETAMANRQAAASGEGAA